MKQRLLFATLAVLTWPTLGSAEPVRLVQGGSELLPPHEIITIVRSTGFDPLGQPVRRGQNYVLRAIDEYDREVDLLVSARSGELLSVHPVSVASRTPPGPRAGGTVGPNERMPPGYVPPPSAYRGGPPIIDEDDDEEPAIAAPRPPASVPGAAPPRTAYPAQPPAAGALPPRNASGPRPSPEPRVITSTEPDQDGTQSGALPPPPERFPQRLATPPVKPKPPAKRTAAVPKQAPLPKPKPQASKVEVAAPPPPEPAVEKASPAAPAPESRPDPVPN